MIRLARPALMLPFVLLAACETPREACVSDAGRQLSIVEALIRETQGNLSRGYAIEESQVVRQVPDLCRSEGDDGRDRTTFCDRTEVYDVERPVAIDPGAERAKLDGLLEQRAQLVATRDARLAGCLALPDA